MYKNTLVSILFFFIVTAIPALDAAAQTTVAGKNGAVASASEIASEVGIAIMQKGGNAVDAAIAVHMALAVVYPQAGNIGGGGFFVIYLAGEQRSTTIDFRETAPAAAHRTMYQDGEGAVIPQLSRRGHMAAGVPGAIAGLWLAHQRYGSLPWQELMQPALDLAEEGFPVSYHLARSLNQSAGSFAGFPATARIFTKESGPWQVGDMLVQADLANTIRAISEQGRDGFYTGPVAEKIATDMKAHGGLITLEDLASYQAIERKPVTGTYRAYRVVSMPPPSSGGILLIQMLNMLEGYDLAQLGHNSAAYIHLLTEIEKRAYADRAVHLGDADFYPVPAAALASKEYANRRVKDIDLFKATPSNEISHGAAFRESEETTHFSVVDNEGNAVACTTTLNGSYGSKVVAPGTGVLLNNEMDDFSIKPGTPNMYGLVGGEANAIEPGKRMLSSMTPTIVLNDHGKVIMITGSPGGSTIITTTLQTILNVLDHGLPLARAVFAPRFHHQWLPDKTYYEDFGFNADTISELVRRGHNPEPRGALGDVHAILFDPVQEVWLAVSDPRHGGAAKAY